MALLLSSFLLCCAQRTDAVKLRQPVSTVSHCLPQQSACILAADLAWGMLSKFIQKRHIFDHHNLAVPNRIFACFFDHFPQLFQHHEGLQPGRAHP